MLRMIWISTCSLRAWTWKRNWVLFEHRCRYGPYVGNDAGYPPSGIEDLKVDVYPVGTEVRDRSVNFRH